MTHGCGSQVDCRNFLLNSTIKLQKVLMFNVYASFSLQQMVKSSKFYCELFVFHEIIILSKGSKYLW